MAGARHHTIPRFLQKGFASRRECDQVYVWVCRRGGVVFETNTENVGAEKHFCGKDGELSVDDEITKQEPSYAEVVDELRGKSGKAEDPRIPALITHLCVRTRYLRMSFETILAEIVASLRAEVCNPVFIRGVWGRNIDEKLIVKKLVENGMSPDRAEELVPLAMPQLPSLLERALPETLAASESAMEMIQEGLPQVAREAHIKALATALATSSETTDRTNRYSRLSWFVVETASPLILGDCVCIFETQGRRRFKPIDEKDDQLERVFLPIAADRVLIGTPYRARPKLDPRRLNEAVAKCSDEFFISSVRREPKSSVVNSLGKSAGILSQEELDQIIGNILSEASSPKLNAAEPKQPQPG